MLSLKHYGYCLILCGIDVTWYHDLFKLFQFSGIESVSCLLLLYRFTFSIGWLSREGLLCRLCHIDSEINLSAEGGIRRLNLFKELNSLFSNQQFGVWNSFFIYFQNGPVKTICLKILLMIFYLFLKKQTKNAHHWHNQITSSNFFLFNMQILYFLKRNLPLCILIERIICPFTLTFSIKCWILGLCISIYSCSCISHCTKPSHQHFI